MHASMLLTAEGLAVTLNAIEVARAAHPDSETRYAICHIQVIIDQDLERFAELDVIAQSTPLWASYDTYGKQFVSDDQFQRYWRFNSLVELGVRFTSGSDFPASGAGTLGISPVVQIEMGHTRQEVGEPDAEMPMGRVEFGGVLREVCLACTPEARVGEYVLVHAGFAIDMVDLEEAQKRLSMLQEIQVDAAG